MRTQVSRWMVMTVLSALGTCAAAGEGSQARLDAAAWEGLRGRLSLSTSWANRYELSSSDSAEPVKVSSFSLMGDYYLSRPWLGTAGGWRATSGVLFGPRPSLWSSPALMDRRMAPTVGLDGTVDDASTLPYLGFGYTGWSLKGGWGLSADLGLMAQPRSAPRLSRHGLSTPDDSRDLRFAPLLQLGLSYTF